MKLISAKSSIINLSLVKPQDQEEFFQISTKHIPAVLAGIKGHERYQPTGETLKNEASIEETYEKKEGRISLSRLIVYCVTALKTGGKTRLAQIANLVTLLNCDLTADPTALEGLEAEVAARLSNANKYSNSSDIQHHIKNRKSKMDSPAGSAHY